ncbi:MAG: GNAT family N-acetyltransferase [Ruminococcaceae bacterium]|nr:GNAT family N-acetyltransferase [Oscillospiraceae bacterium]
MVVRRANMNDIDGINRLLIQVLKVHHDGRPDLFKALGKKYNDEQLKKIISDENTPVFVAMDDTGSVVGHAFCIFRLTENSNVLNTIKTLYIDDLCVDEKSRGKHIGSLLYDNVVDFARKSDCYNITLNVWSCNEGAMKFYKSCGLVPQSITMEKIL